MNAMTWIATALAFAAGVYLSLNSEGFEEGLAKSILAGCVIGGINLGIQGTWKWFRTPKEVE